MVKRALCSWGGWDGHTPEKSTLMMRDLLVNENFQVDLVNSLEPLNKLRNLRQYDVIIFCWTMSKITSDQEKNLSQAVMKGTGLVGWHGGLNDAFRENVGYQFMTGAQWVSHPEGAKQKYMVNFVPRKQEDPIIKGLTDFKIQSEQYYMHIDPAVEVLATTTFHNKKLTWINGVKMPVTYKKRWGKGKVFYTSIGHTFKDFQIPEALEMMRRGILWAATKERSTFEAEDTLDLLDNAF
jgi:uncharacterized protein